jgi:hypothetical protein
MNLLSCRALTVRAVKMNYWLILERAKRVGSRIPKLAAIIVVLFCIAGVILTACTMSTKQLLNRRLVYYKHPCIVLKVDNRGCQAEIEMREHVVAVPRLAR